MAKHRYLEKTGSRKRHKGDMGGEDALQAEETWSH